VTAGVCVTVTVGAAVTVGVTLILGVTRVLGVAVTVGVILTEGVTVAGAELPPPDVGGTEPLAEGRNVVADAAGGDDDVQPASAAEPRTVAVQPSAVSSARSAVPLRGLRTLFRYPIGQL
jgi:hypothetical protein